MVVDQTMPVAGESSRVLRKRSSDDISLDEMDDSMDDSEAEAGARVEDIRLMREALAAARAEVDPCQISPAYLAATHGRKMSRQLVDNWCSADEPHTPSPREHTPRRRALALGCVFSS